MVSKSYSSHRLEDVRRTPLIVSMSRIMGGMVLLLVVGFGLQYAFSLVQQGMQSSLFALLLTQPELFYPVMESGDILGILGFLNGCGFLLASVVAGTICAFSAFYFVGEAMKSCLIGARDIITPYKPAHVPTDLSLDVHLKKLLREGEIDGLYEGTNELKTLALFGEQVQFITPAARKIVRDNVKSLYRRLWRVFYLLVFAVILYWGWDFLSASSWFTGQTVQVRQQWSEIASVSNWNLLLVPVMGLALAHIFMIGIEYVSTVMLTPKEDPSTQTLVRSKSYSGFANPRQLVSAIPELADCLAWRDFPNRVRQGTFEESESPSFSEGGKFTSTIFIEQQPQPAPDRITTAGTLLIISGWFLKILSTVLLFAALLPFPVQKYLIQLTVSDRFLLAPIYVMLTALLVYRLSRDGNTLTRQAYGLFKSMRFRSESILMDIEGDLSRSNITIGKAVDDSIESSNQVVRSDFSVKFWAGQIHSESVALDGKRLPLSVSQSRHSLEWIDELKGSIETLRSSGVVPVGVGISSPEVNILVSMNAQNKAQKETTTRAALVAQENALMYSQVDPGLTARQQLSCESNDDFMPCPTCAEWIRTKARICRYCKTEVQSLLLGETD